MTKISAKIVADSINVQGDRITTMLLTFPRFILAELNTHRMFSKNSASSRAIPFNKMVESVQNDPFIPIAWQKDHKGMQGSEYLDDTHIINFGMGVRETQQTAAIKSWLMARDNAIRLANVLNNNQIQCTKQLCNRLLEPFMWHTVILTSTDFENFFKLRCSQYNIFSENIPLSFRSKKDLLEYVHQVEAPEFKNQYDNLTELDWLQLNKGQAEIHMMALAEAMWDAFNESKPKFLEPGMWHIPFHEQINLDKLKEAQKILDNPKDRTLAAIKISTAMCARTSYTVVGEEGKEPNYENDIKLHDRLLNSGHYSPFEHCAKAMDADDYDSYIRGKVDIFPDGEISHVGWKNMGWCRNYKGFIQYRELIEK